MFGRGVVELFGVEVSGLVIYWLGSGSFGGLGVLGHNKIMNLKEFITRIGKIKYNFVYVFIELLSRSSFVI